MTQRLFFDTRRLDQKGRGTLRYIISKRGKTAMFSLDIKLLPEQWDGSKVINHPDAKLYNSIVKMKLGSIERTLMEKEALGLLGGKSSKEIVDLLIEVLDPDQIEVHREKLKKTALAHNGLAARFELSINKKTNAGTRQLYRDTLNKISAFCKASGKDLLSVSLDDVDESWLSEFEQYCRQTQKQNTTSRHLRDIRAVFNSAIDDGVTTQYPFRKYKINREETLDKSYSAAELRTLFEFDCYEGFQREAIDMFKLMFCLIGINSVDLANASDIERGRLNYVRAKTHKPYSIKIEPETLQIIEQYKGNDGHLVRLLETSHNYKTYFNRMGKTLRKVGLKRIPGKHNTGKALLPDICTGSARTSWATIAQEELDIPREVIAAALGHHTVDVTSTYLRTDWKKKIDDANRKVLDWVFYKKAPKK